MRYRRGRDPELGRAAEGLTVEDHVGDRDGIEVERAVAPPAGLAAFSSGSSAAGSGAGLGSGAERGSGADRGATAATAALSGLDFSCKAMTNVFSARSLERDRLLEIVVSGLGSLDRPVFGGLDLDRLEKSLSCRRSLPETSVTLAPVVRTSKVARPRRTFSETRSQVFELVGFEVDRALVGGVAIAALEQDFVVTRGNVFRFLRERPDLFAIDEELDAILLAGHLDARSARCFFEVEVDRHLAAGLDRHALLLRRCTLRPTP